MKPSTLCFWLLFVPLAGIFNGFHPPTAHGVYLALHSILEGVAFGVIVSLILEFAKWATGDNGEKWKNG